MVLRIPSLSLAYMYAARNTHNYFLEKLEGKMAFNIWALFENNIKLDVNKTD
jgi:hypothetical protein